MEITVLKGQTVSIRKGSQELLSLSKTNDRQDISIITNGIVTTDSLIEISKNLELHAKLVEKAVELPSKDEELDLYLVSGETVDLTKYVWLVKLPKFENYAVTEKRLESIVLRLVMESKKSLYVNLRTLSVTKITIGDRVPYLLPIEAK